MIYPIYIYGSPVLRQEAQPVDMAQITPQLIADFFETMHAAQGVGLAAPQVGMALRMFVIDLTAYADEEPSLAQFKKVFINPEIYAASEETAVEEEGCLSLPGLREEVVRPASIRIRYRDENGVDHDEQFTGYPARVIQHEYDHLESKVFTDRISPLRKALVRGKLGAMSKGMYSADYRTKLSK